MSLFSKANADFVFFALCTDASVDFTMAAGAIRTFWNKVFNGLAFHLGMDHALALA